MCGIDHKRADLDARSRFSLTSKKIEEAYEAFRCEPLVGGAVIISTCNRTELWVHTRGHGKLSPAKLLLDFLCLPAHEDGALFEERCSKDAIDHLFRLSAGLESKIVCEMPPFRRSY